LARANATSSVIVFCCLSGATRGEVAARIEGKVFDHRLYDRHLRRGREQGIAVGRRFGHRLTGRDYASTGPVLDHDGLAQCLLQARGEQARRQVRDPAGLACDDETDWFARVLGMRGVCAKQASDGDSRC
jgi:hypothetical protein